MKKILLAFAMAALLVGQAQSQTVTLRAAHTSAATEPFQIGLQSFADSLQKVSGGSIKTEIFPNAQLGDESSVLKSIQSGGITPGPVSKSPPAGCVPGPPPLDPPFPLPAPPPASPLFHRPTPPRP